MGWWVGSYPVLSQVPTPFEVELGCDNLIPRTTISVVTGEIVSRSTIRIRDGNKDDSQIVTRNVATNIETFDISSASNIKRNSIC